MVAGFSESVGFRPIEYPKVVTSSPAVASVAGSSSSEDVGRKTRSRKVVNFSKVTASYDRSGNYPALKIFQYARPQPEYKPYGNLVSSDVLDENPPFLGAYAPKSERRSEFVDRRA